MNTIPTWRNTIGIYALEGRAKSQLQHSRLIRQIVGERWLAVIRIAFVCRICAIVRVIEQVEHFENAVYPDAFGNWQLLLEPHIDAMDRSPYETLARDDGGIPPVALQGDGGPAGFVTNVRTEDRSETLA